MAYFGKDFIKFFKELSANNNRDWFAANKQRYETNVKEPFYNLVAELITMISFEDPHVVSDPADAIFRIYRDIRFSKDKSPYKLFASAIISSKGRNSLEEPGFYFELSHKGIDIYAGVYQPDKNALARIRNYIAAHSKEFRKLLKAKKFVNTYGYEILGEKSKRLPKEFEAAAQKEPLIYNTQFYYHSKLPVSLITSDELCDRLFNCYKACKPLNDFFKSALK